VNPWRWVDPRVASVRLADARAYLLGRGWKLRPSPSRNTLLFERPGTGGAGPLLQALPSSEEFSDYSRHITDFLTVLSEIEDRHPVALLEDILRQSSAGDLGATGGGHEGVGPSGSGAGGEAPRRKRRKRPA
jgi:hypothetical protein